MFTGWSPAPVTGTDAFGPYVQPGIPASWSGALNHPAGSTAAATGIAISSRKKGQTCCPPKAWNVTQPFEASVTRAADGQPAAVSLTLIDSKMSSGVLLTAACSPPSHAGSPG